MLTRKLLKRINARPRGKRRWPLVALGVVAAALITFLLLSRLAALAVLAAGAGGVLLACGRGRAGRRVSLNYDLDVETGARFVAVGEACESLATAEKVWLLGGRGGGKPRGAGANPGNRSPIRVGRLETPGIDANVDIWGIDAGEVRVLFFPEGVLVYRQEQYRSVSYAALGVILSFVRFVEREAVPADAEVLGHKRHSVPANSGPDRRYRSDLQPPTVMYGVLRLTGPTGLDMRLLVSNRAAAARFAQAFGAREGTRDERSRRGSFGLGDRKRVGTPAGEEPTAPPARVALGVASGASEGEIIAAYRDLARIYHPDKVANLPPEIREFADLKMKEINAAYAELKRRGNRGHIITPGKVNE
jgi:hypothetical protein